MIITRCVKNLDFIAISDKDNALVVVEHEGVRLIKAIKNYPTNKEILDILTLLFPLHPSMESHRVPVFSHQVWTVLRKRRRTMKPCRMWIGMTLIK